jgi:sec-independent protein translocase protein TatA
VIGDILSPTHLLFILVVALLVLGPKRLPEAGRALGRGIRDFRMAIGGDDQTPGAFPTATMNAPSPPMNAMPVSPAPEPAEAPPPPPPASGPPPPAGTFPAVAEPTGPSPATVPAPLDQVQSGDTTEATEPARPFV